MRISADAAETLALQALAWLVTNEELLPVFLGSTGADIGDLRARAGDRQFLASVLDFLTMDDAWVIAFCDEQGIAYDQPMQARAVLGGDEMHWT
ncbi:DUF3572 domain-containing protein [Ruegeria pomeroyi]|uniref:DUF3572 domain-containing protein n=2 Tax=Ruegeria pomeroyi TaxID=89184 RepID=Q5LPU7_RUEPO|nr:DUF3572 domain-containing protein [Ruegeria pomeroyi]HCE70661.1 DUF3572 domain-containing protein [Ruegeria sp.]AAV95993.1 hypothetical protein SPO2752 [Ruegeria pomeroyi DSS-3]NVK97643.1 DUF3572 domain-containing protein [Ruegeria pomeroyi]NVL01349.1 DUF3572 domain-containing protein [Ruegeria pomeroyi]QWV09555.1 DUF3572 domain-containing protein [Ruegeria pomeroyi]